VEGYWPSAFINVKLCQFNTVMQEHFDVLSTYWQYLFNRSRAEPVFLRVFRVRKPPGALLKFKFLCRNQNLDYICTRLRAISSAGSEHLPYKQRVGGSNPSSPTTGNRSRLHGTGFFVLGTNKDRRNQPIKIHITILAVC
jgi:hypothetical protein